MRVAVGDSGLGRCAWVRSFECWLTPLCVKNKPHKKISGGFSAWRDGGGGGGGGGGKELGVGVGGAKHQSQTSKTFISSPGACTSGSSLNKARASSVELNLSLM